MAERRKRILLVDDSRTALMMTALLLRGGPFELLTAENGRVAIEKAQQAAPDLVLLDVVMPVMDGFEVVKHLRQEERTRNLPVVMLTTRGESDNVEQGFRLGCTDYLTKPVNGPELLAKINAVLGVS